MAQRELFGKIAQKELFYKLSREWVPKILQSPLVKDGFGMVSL
jgi:hypothetical protein